MNIRCKLSAFRYKHHQILTAVQCFSKHSAFRYKHHQILTAVQYFSKHCSSHHQSEYALVRDFWQLYVRQGVGKAVDVMEPIGVVEEWAVSNGR
jgi:hypothetical protein